MRPLGAEEMLAGVLRVLGLESRPTLLEALGGPLWVDWVADTGDDHDVSQAVGRMLFAEYTVDDEGGPMTLPRGDVLLFGGDTAYPVATADEIYNRVIRPWNEILRENARVSRGVRGCSSASRATTTGTTGSTASGASSGGVPNRPSCPGSPSPLSPFTTHATDAAWASSRASCTSTSWAASSG